MLSTKTAASVLRFGISFSPVNQQCGLFSSWLIHSLAAGALRLVGQAAQLTIGQLD
jgi:hypothetical protein